jgi:hypothetical protein
MSLSRLSRRVAPTLLIFLSGCSWFSSDDPPPAAASVTPAPAPPITISGAVAKGVVWQGVVQLRERQRGEWILLGASRTGEDGSYSLTLPASYRGGALQVEVTADDETLTRCDHPTGCGPYTDYNGKSHDLNSNEDIDWGEWFKPQELTLTALLPPQSTTTSTVTASVTPWSHMAAQRALKLASADESNLTSAITLTHTELVTLLKFDPITTQPIDITLPDAVEKATGEQRLYAAKSAAIMALAMAKADTATQIPDIAATLDELATTWANQGGFKGTSTADEITLRQMVELSRAVMEQAEVIDNSNLLNELEDLASELGESISGDGASPIPPPTLGDPTAATRAFIASARTWATVIMEEQEEQLTLEQSLGIFSDEYAMVRQIAAVAEDRIAPTLAAAVRYAIAAWMAEAESIANLEPDALWLEDEWRDIFPVHGEVSYQSDYSDSHTITLSNALFRLDEAGTLDNYATAPLDQQMSVVEKLTLRLPMVDNDTPIHRAEIDVSGKIVGDRYTLEMVPESQLILLADRPLIVNREWSAWSSDQGIAAVTLSGEMRLNGTLRHHSERREGVHYAHSNPVTFTGTLRHTPVAVAVEEQSLAWENQFAGFSLRGRLARDSGFAFDTTLNLNLHGLPRDLAESEDEWQRFEFGFSLEKQLTDLPPATFTLSGRRSGYDHGELALRISHSNDVLLLNSLVEIDNSGNGQSRQEHISIRAANGVTMRMAMPASEERKAITRRVIGDIHHLGRHTATMVIINGQLYIEYPDNSFELF